MTNTNLNVPGGERAIMKPLDFDEAKTLLEKADAAGLHSLVISTEQTNAKLREVLDTLMAVYVDKPTAALHQQQNPDVIAAMRDVSLAALALAQGIAEGRDDEGTISRENP